MDIALVLETSAGSLLAAYSSFRLVLRVWTYGCVCGKSRWILGGFVESTSWKDKGIAASRYLRGCITTGVCLWWSRRYSLLWRHLSTKSEQHQAIKFQLKPLQHSHADVFSLAPESETINLAFSNSHHPYHYNVIHFPPPDPYPSSPEIICCHTRGDNFL